MDSMLCSSTTRQIFTQAIARVRGVFGYRKDERPHPRSGRKNKGLDQNLKDVRLAIETRLQLNAGALKGRKSDIDACIDEILSECASCQADLSDRKDHDDLRDPNDGRLYCVSCWKAMALRG